VKKLPIEDQVVLVAGGSSGIGRAVTRAAAARGARVVVSSRSAEALDAAVEEIERSGADALAVPADITSDADVDRLVAHALERFGRLDSVVATAFVSVYAEVDRLELAELQRIVDVNFVGRVRLFKAALPALRESRGTFVDVNSALAYRGIPLQATYCATKAATRAFWEGTRLELDREGGEVAISVVLPGAVNTPHFDRVRQKLGLQPQPVPPIYQPEVVAEAVVHCCERPERELPVTWGAQQALWGAKSAPRLLDLWFRRTGWDSQTTGEPKPVDAPDNLWHTLPGDPGAHGRFDDVARTSSVWTAARLARGRLAVAVAVFVGAGLATMQLRNRR
jgi:NAD(P)-dependent dehydrogenase (short-subunit alcohol dehydrogenase family)